MRYVKNTLFAIFLILFAGLLHYVLPQHDVAKVTSTEIIRMDFSGINRPFYAQSDSGNAELTTRDIRLINSVKKKTMLLGFIQRDKEEVMVYRNEDTGWIWPPYFKFDSSDLQAEASAAVAKGDEQWVVVTHYGWRNKLFTIYPNAIGIRQIEGPDVRIIPWFNIVFFAFLIFAYFFTRAMWRQFRERKLDPAMEDTRDAWEKVDAYADERRGRVKTWLDSWKSK